MLRDHFAAVGLQICSASASLTDKPLFRQLNRRTDHFVQRHGAILFQREGEPATLPRAGG